MTEPTITRRAVLRAGAAGVALVALPVRAVEALAAASTATNTWTYSQWSSLVNTTFKCALPNGTTTNLKLVAATNLMPAGSSTTSGPQTFSLTFSGAPSPALGQATQSLFNAKTGTVQLFLVPGEATSTALRYGAIVNRL